MINNSTLNEAELNFLPADLFFKESENYTSFSTSQITKYALKTNLGQYFNFGNFLKYKSGICGIGDQILYGNILLETDIENLSEKEIIRQPKPILNGAIMQGYRFHEKEIYFSFKIIPKDFEPLEKEIQSIKKTFNSVGNKLIKKEKNRISELSVILSELEVGKLSLKGTTVDATFISMESNFKVSSGNTKAYRNISGDLDVSLVINDTDEKPYIETLIDLKNVSGSITKIILGMGGYEVEIDSNISSPEKIIFNGRSKNIFIGETEIKDFKGKFMPFEIGSPQNISVRFVGGEAQNYSIYFTYDNIYL